MNQPPNAPPEPDKQQDRILDHEYDGIREYDNPMPRWWVGMFWATIVFSVLYYLNIIPGIGSGKGWIANYEREMKNANVKAAAVEAATPKVEYTDDAIWAFTKDPAALAAGKQTFTTSCAACHRPDGGGNIGPDLTDDYWLHGNQPMQIVHTITVGVPEKGMPTWGPMLKPEQIAHVAAYVLSLHGSNPANPKPPQGDKLPFASPGAAATPAK